MNSVQSNRLAGSFLLACTAVAGCGGGSGTAAGGPPPFGPVFSEIQASVFTPACATSGCHIGAGAPQGLRLDAASSHGLLVGTASTEVPSLLRVEAGVPDNSYLVQKLEGTAAVGARMPLGGAPLEQTAIDTIRQWISDGATDDRVQSSAPIRVTSLSPAPGATLESSPGSIVVTFDREVDVSTVNANTFRLEASGGDGNFGDGNERAIIASAISTPMLMPRTVTFDLGGEALADDTYRVVLFGSGASCLMDIDANSLDGEFAGRFPSGDGSGGGDFAATFEISVTQSGPASGPAAGH